MKENIITRRDFLKSTAAASLGLSLGLPAYLQSEKMYKSKVVLIRHPDVIDAKGKINQKIVQQMIDEAVTTFIGTDNPRDAWKKFIKPTDIVGIKSNVWSYLPTPKEIENVLVMRIQEAGISKKNIDIDDRGVLSNKIFLNSTALINVRPLRTHHWSGIGGCIKNYVMFTPRPADYHPDSCADLGALWKLPIVKDKTRLNFLLLLTPQFHHIGAHHFDPKYTWQYKGILVGTDPVALDAVGLRLFELKRRAYFKEESPISPSAKHVALADTRHKIGISNLKEIDLVKLGWREEILLE